jgi:hypothetical protein
MLNFQTTCVKQAFGGRGGGPGGERILFFPTFYHLIFFDMHIFQLPYVFFYFICIQFQYLKFIYILVLINLKL